MTGTLDWKWIGIGVVVMIVLNLIAGLILGMFLGSQLEGVTSPEELQLTGGQIVLASVLNFLAFAIGGFIVAFFMLNLTSSQYWTTAWQALEWNDLAQGLIKPFVFAMVISLVGCYYGIQTKGGTQGEGRATTQAVVVASVWIFVITFFITRVFV